MGGVILPRIKVYNADFPPPMITLRCVGDAGVLKHTEVSEVVVKGAQRILATLKEALFISEEIFLCRVRKRTLADPHEVGRLSEEVVSEDEAKVGIEAERLDLWDFRTTFEDSEIKDGDTIGIYNRYRLLTPEEAEIAREREEKRLSLLSPIDQGVPDLTVPYNVISSLLMHPDLF